MVRRIGGLILAASMLALTGCSSTTAEDDIGPGGDTRPVSEDTAARCQDGIDNDGDGATDCADPDCQLLVACVDAAAPKDTRPDVAPDHRTIDGQPPVDAPVFDGGVDGPGVDGPAVTCGAHCDCPQGSFCFIGKCVFDPLLPVYCCASSGCPPGRWCFDQLGKKSTCAESTSYTCKDACDCGPAHCCQNGVCVKDTQDPLTPGGQAVGPSCKKGIDATYCCGDPTCHSGRQAFAAQPEYFRCYNRKDKRTQGFCSGKPCFGSACACGPGQACVDTLTFAQLGETCLLLSGGSCVSSAVATAIFGATSSALIPCCSKGCIAGTPCDVGWRQSQGRFAYERIVGSCGVCANGTDWSCGKCGNKTCDPGEFPKTCPGDCWCGDGTCSPSEAASCPNDCGTCGNGACEAGESPKSCADDCKPVCGDNYCQAGEPASCAKDCPCPDSQFYPGLPRACGDGHCASQACGEPETCLTCPRDCGACEWSWVRTGSGASGDINAVWADSASDIFVVGSKGTILRHNGSGWGAQLSGVSGTLLDVWGATPKEIFAVAPGGIVQRYDGAKWTKMASAPPGWLAGVWGTSPTNVYVAAQGIWRFNGSGWLKVATSTHHFNDIWGASASEIWAVGEAGQVLRYTKGAWKASQLGPGTAAFHAIWGASASDVYAVGQQGLAYRFDGKSWISLNPPVAAQDELTGVWGDGVTLTVVSNAGTILAYDLASKKWTVQSQGTLPPLKSAGGSLTTGPIVVGKGGTIFHRKSGSWVSMTDWAPHDLTGIDGNTNDLYAVGAYGQVLHRGGTGWASQPRVTLKRLNDVWYGSPQDVFMVGGDGSGGVTIRYPNASWSAPKALQAVWGSSGSNVFAVGEYGTVLQFDGNTWSALNPNTTNTFLGVWGASGATVFAVGFGGSALRFDGSWSAWTLGSGWLGAVWGSGAANVHAVGAMGISYNYDGANWVANATPTTANLNGVAGSSGTNVIAVGNNGARIRYTGSQWVQVRCDLRRLRSSGYTCPVLRDVWVSTTEAVAVGNGGVVVGTNP